MLTDIDNGSGKFGQEVTVVFKVGQVVMDPARLQPLNLARSTPRRHVPDIEEGAEVPSLPLAEPLLDPSLDVAWGYFAPFTHQ